MIKLFFQKILFRIAPIDVIGRLVNEYQLKNNDPFIIKNTPGKRRWFTNPKISVGANVRIAQNAKVQVRYGGEITIEENTELLDGVLVLTYGGKIKIGKNCSINPYTIIYGHGGTTIGDNVLIAGQCMIIPNTHKFAEKETLINQQGNKAIGITIEDDVWISHGCSILDGVVIGKGAVVAAGSVVNKSVEPYTVVGGVPAVKIKKRGDDNTKN